MATRQAIGVRQVIGSWARRSRVACWPFAVAACGLAMIVAPAAAITKPSDDTAIMRITQSPEGKVALEIAVRELVPPEGEEDLPVVSLVGVAHIGTEQFYEQMQRALDGHDIVLYEGVGPGWSRLPEYATSRHKELATRGRIRFAAIVLERARREGINPEDVTAVAQTLPGYERRMFDDAMVDAWGRPLELSAPDGVDAPFELCSLGADGRPGGVGLAEDICLSGLDPLTDAELASEEGIQPRLAAAAGLVFQLNAMDYTHAHWHNADMTVEQLVAALSGGNQEAGLNALEAEGEADDGSGGDANALLGLLSGRSAMAKVISGVLGFFEKRPGAQAMLRVALIEMLGRADELMEATGEMAPEMGEMMDVLLSERNSVVLEQFHESLKDHPERVAIFFGSGHLPDLQQRLIEEHGYHVGETKWIEAMSVDPKADGLDANMVGFVRSMVASSLEQQLATARHAARLRAKHIDDEDTGDKDKGEDGDE